VEGGIYPNRILFCFGAINRGDAAGRRCWCRVAYPARVCIHPKYTVCGEVGASAVGTATSHVVVPRIKRAAEINRIITRPVVRQARHIFAVPRRDGASAVEVDPCLGYPARGIGGAACGWAEVIYADRAHARSPWIAASTEEASAQAPPAETLDGELDAVLA